MSDFTESVVEDAALAWLESLGYAIKHGPEIAPGELFAEREEYGQVILAIRLRDALVRLNPILPAEAIDDAFRKLARLEGAALDARNRTFHRLLVDGVTVEYRADGAIRGAQARLIDFDNPDNNDWLAVNQFTVVENKHNRRPDIVIFEWTAAPSRRAEECRGRGRDDLGCLSATADLPGRDPVSVRL
jgi:type I restriction enzyme, R subunit